MAWLLLAALWLLLVDKLSRAELIADAAVATLATVVLGLVLEHGGRLPFQVRLGDVLLIVRRLPPRALVASLQVLRVCASRRPGFFTNIPFDPGGADARSVARRALVTAGLSVSPTAYVVGLNSDRRQVLLHQLVATPRPPGEGDQEWPL